MIEITDDLLDAAVAAYVDAIDLGVTNKHIATKILEAVIPLIAAAEREECAKLVALRTREIYPPAVQMAADFIATDIRARGAS